MEKHQMPIKSIHDTCWSGHSSSEFKKEIQEVLSQESYLQSSEITQSKIQQRMEFSSYILNPNKFRFQTVIRIVAIVLKFTKCLRTKSKVPQKSTKKITFKITEAEINDAKIYFYRKTALEVVQFNKKQAYEKFSGEKDGILWYTGRILPSDHVSAVGKLISSMLDLTSTTFCVPIVDSYSPLACSMINDIHWYDKTLKHSGVESAWHQGLKSCIYNRW